MMVKTRCISFLQKSPKLDGLTDVLTILSRKPVHFNHMFKESNVRFKNASLKYSNICREKGFIVGKIEQIRIPVGRGISRPRSLMVYHVTARGALFLELVK